MSGLNQQFTKLSVTQVAREFESHILRQVLHSAKSQAESCSRQSVC